MGGSTLKKWADDKTKPPSLGSKLYADLGDDFPADARAWMKGVPWEGPEDVPVSKIDYSNEKSWKASKDPEQVESFRTKIRGGWKKPVILVQKPGTDKATVIDGHHRALAYRAEGMKVPAYVASPKMAAGPWDEMHAAQNHGGGLAASMSRA